MHDHEVHQILERLASLESQVGHVQRGLQSLTVLTEKVLKMATALDAAITQLQTDVAALTAVDQSAIALINGIAKQVADALARITFAAYYLAEPRPGTTRRRALFVPRR